MVVGSGRMAERDPSLAPVSFTGRLFSSGRHGSTGRNSFLSWCILLYLPVILFTAAAGCGGTPVSTRPEGEVVVEDVLRAALEGEKAEFVTMVAPSFLAAVRSEMPDTDDETLGGVLIAGFLENIPFSAVVDADYSIDTTGDRAAVYVWGVFLDGNGLEMEIAEAAAVRIPLIRENGRWYLDLLDL